MVATLPAVLAGIGLLVLPGMAFLALLPREERQALAGDERLFLAVAGSVMLAAWLGLILAEAGLFSLVTAGCVVGFPSLLVIVWRARQASWRLAPRRPSWRVWVPFGLILALALALFAHPSEYIVGGRDPGVYIASMALVGRTGGIAYTDPTVLSIPPEAVELFFRNAGAGDFSTARLMGFPLESPTTGRVFAEFFHLFPVFGAYLFQAAGIKGALATPPVFGVLGVLACFLAFRRLVGPAAALLGTSLLTINVIQVWFARYPVSEPMSQFLLFTGVLALWHWEERGHAAFGLLAGAAFGLSLLVRIDSVLILVPLALYVGIRRVRRDLAWRQALLLIVPFGLLAAHAAFHAAIWSRKYVIGILERPYWRLPLWAWAAALLALGGAMAVVHVVAPRLLALWERHARGLRLASVVFLGLLAAYAYFLRPLLSLWSGADGWNESERVLTGPAWLVLLMTHPWLGWRHLARHDAEAFVRLGWFIHPLGLVLAVAGLLWVVWRSRPRWLFLLLMALFFSGFYFYKMRVWNDYYFATRRFVPVILPCAVTLAAYALVSWGRRGTWRVVTAVIVTLGLVALFARDTAAIARHVDWKGSVAEVDELARFFGQDDIVIFEQPESIHLLSLPLWAAHGVPILQFARWNPDPGRLNSALRKWRGQGRNVYFVYTYKAAEGLCGVFLQRVRDFQFSAWEWERSYTAPPRHAVLHSPRFTVARMVLPEELQVPPLPELDVGGSDDFQVSGCFAKEGHAPHTFRWTGPCASFYLPALRGAHSLSIVAGIGRRPMTTTVPVQVLVGDSLVGTFIAEPEWKAYRFDVRGHNTRTGLVQLRDIPTFRPADTAAEDPEADSRDVRKLGVMIDRILVDAPDEQGATR